MEKTELATQSPQGLIALAIEKGSSIEYLNGLMQLQKQWEEKEAKKTFFLSLSQFQKNCPALEKKKLVSFETTKYKYAPLGEIAEAIKNPLSDAGLSFRWEFADKEDSIVCTCIVAHLDGHSEKSSMSAKKDSSGRKNEIQSRGSTMTYLQRYTLISSLGISTADEDNDGQTPKPTTTTTAPAKATQTTPKQAEQPKQTVDKPKLQADAYNGLKSAFEKWDIGAMEIFLSNENSVKEAAEKAGLKKEHVPATIEKLKAIMNLKMTVADKIEILNDATKLPELHDWVKEMVSPEIQAHPDFRNAHAKKVLELSSAKK